MTEFEAVWSLAFIIMGATAGAALGLTIVNAVLLILTGRELDD